jgi:hypothetical protein
MASFTARLEAYFGMFTRAGGEFALGALMSGVFCLPPAHAETCPPVLQKLAIQTLGNQIASRMIKSYESGSQVDVEMVPQYFLNGLNNQSVTGVSSNEIYNSLGMGSQRTDKLLACFPQLRSFLATVEAKRQEARQQLEDNLQKANAENDKPAHVLVRSYADYIYIKNCYNQRKGYLAVNVSDEEFERARTAVQKVEQKMIDLEPRLDKDALWKSANGDGKDWQTNRDKVDYAVMSTIKDSRQKCQRALSDLEATYKRFVPEARIMKKDF